MNQPGVSARAQRNPAAAGAFPPAQSTAALARGVRVDEFEILDTLGEGGFGIVYRARDHSLQRTVALKEYMPGVLATRSATRRVSVKSGEFVETFLAGLRSFINEAQMLAQFDHPALVKVHRFCEANGTAYMAMPLYEGGMLKQALRARAARGAPPPDEAWLRALIEPLLDALALLHRERCLHRDIAPDNILLLGGDRTPPQPLLLDFGAARRVIGEHTQALTVILKPGYAPIEQYDETAGLRQGPWTDLYALAAVLVAAITGKAPPAAVGRLVQDAYVPLAGLTPRASRYSDTFLTAIDRALAPLPQDRPRDVAAWRDMLGPRQSAARSDAGAEPPARHIAPATPPVSDGPSSTEPAAPKRRRRRAWWGVIALAGVLTVGALVNGHRRAAAPVAPGSTLTVVPTAPSSAPATDAGPTGNQQGVYEPAKPADEAETVAGTANWVREALREARQCLVAKRYACTIQRAEEVLKSQPTHAFALRMARLGYEGLQANAGGGRKKP